MRNHIHRYIVLLAAAAMPIVLAAFFIAFSSMPGLVARSADVAPSDDILVRARKAVAARLEALQNLSVRYNQSISYTPRQDLAAALSDAFPKDIIATTPQLTTTTEELLVLGDRTRLTVHLNSDSLKATHDKGGMPHDFVDVTYITTPSRCEELRSNPGSLRALGFITGPEGPHLRTYIDIALGLRMAGAEKFMKPADFEDMAISVSQEGVIFEKKGESVTHQWIFDPKQEFALVKYQTFGPKRPSASTEFSYEKFKRIDGLMLPTVIVRKDNVVDGQPAFATTTVNITVLSCKLGDEKNTPDLYKMVYPLNSIVTDERNHVTLKIDKKAEVLEDADINIPSSAIPTAPRQ